MNKSLEITPQDVEKATLQDLAKSGITLPAQIKRFGATPLMPDEVYKLAKLRIPAYSIPYNFPNGTRNGHARIKLLAPVPGKKQKYWQEAGSEPHIYFPPFKIKRKSLDKVLADPSHGIYITEGEKKAACAIINGIACLGLGGVWSWKGNGEPIEDFALVEWHGRIVVIVFDSDVTTNPDVQFALRCFADYLRSLGATVLIKILPSRGKQKVGLDDFIVANGIKAFKQLPEIRFDDPQYANWGVPEVVTELNKKHAFVMINGKATVLTESEDPEWPGTKAVTLSRQQDIQALYANRSIIVGDSAKPTNKFKYWWTNKMRREVSRIWFSPGQSWGLNPDTGEFNLWQGWPIQPHPPDKKHSWDLLNAHVHEVIADGDDAVADYLFSWMAYGIQQPAKLPETAIVTKGGEGTGKGTLWQALGKLYGRHFMHVVQKSHLVGTFNDLHKDKLLVYADESFYAGDHAAASALKAIITERKMIIEPKYVNPYELPNYRKLVISSNEDWVVSVGPDARRYVVLDVSERRRGDHNYFRRIYKELENGGYEAMMYDLLHRDLSSFDPRNIPQTNALLDQKKLTWDPVTRWWFDVLSSEAKWEGWVYADEARGQIMLHYTSKHDNQRAIETQIGVRLKKLIPSRKHKQRERIIGGGTQRKWAYEFPTLSTCRREFEKATRTRINWETGELA